MGQILNKVYIHYGFIGCFISIKSKTRLFSAALPHLQNVDWFFSLCLNPGQIL